MIAIVDYGVGNLYSLRCSLDRIGADSIVTGDPAALRNARRIILPGVGAFADAAAKLRERGLDAVLTREARGGKPLLGICLGMQLLYGRSCEYGDHLGLGLLPGSVESLAEALGPGREKVPHMGWNALRFERESPLLANTVPGDYVYFVHSYYAPASADTAATVQYGAVTLTAVAAAGNVFGTQFHPEKSGRVGLGLLDAFAKLKD